MLADDAHHGARRRALCPAGGDELVRGQPHRLHLRSVRHKTARSKVDEVADNVHARRAIELLPILRGYAETRHKAKSWDRERRALARIEATELGLDIRFVVTSLNGSAEWIYDSLIVRAERPRT